MKRQRMWMEVGVWPPPARAQWRPTRRAQLQRWRWITAGVIVSAMLGAAMGSVATLVLVRLLGTVCA